MPKTALLALIPLVSVLSCSGKPASKTRRNISRRPPEVLRKGNELMDKEEHEEARTALLEIKAAGTLTKVV